MRTLMSRRCLVLAAATLALGALPFSPAAANASFKGKTVQVGIASSPGGGTDRTGRLVGQYFEKYLPGKPSVVIKNFGAGGGKIRAHNYLALEAPSDGTFVLQTDASPIQPHVLRKDVSRYDPTKYEPVGAINRGGSVFFVRKEAHPRLKDMSAKPVIVGALSGTRSWQMPLMLAREHMGWNLKWIPGYKGTSSLEAALRRGEIDMFATNNVYIIDGLTKDGVVDLLFQEGQAAEGGYVARETYPDVPIFPEMMKKANVPEIAVKAYNAVMKPGEADKWMTLPPGTPKDVVQAYRDAYAKVVKDPKFLEVAKKQLSPEIYYLSGETVMGIIKETAAIPDEAIDYGAKLRKKFNISAR